jgi:hypothetical protein
MYSGVATPKCQYFNCTLLAPERAGHNIKKMQEHIKFTAECVLLLQHGSAPAGWNRYYAPAMWLAGDVTGRCTYTARVILAHGYDERYDDSDVGFAYNTWVGVLCLAPLCDLPVAKRLETWIAPASTAGASKIIGEIIKNMFPLTTLEEMADNPQFLPSPELVPLIKLMLPNALLPCHVVARGVVWGSHLHDAELVCNFYAAIERTGNMQGLVLLHNCVAHLIKNKAPCFTRTSQGPIPTSITFKRRKPRHPRIRVEFKEVL